jgi:uncharacterized membrane protein YciS (DUF1049 family)
MSFKAVFRAVVFLAILFVILYLGMNNTQVIDFNFPVALSQKVRAEAGWIYFGVFAVGVLAGTVLTAGSGKKAGSASKSSK